MSIVAWEVKRAMTWELSGELGMFAISMGVWFPGCVGLSKLIEPDL